MEKKENLTDKIAVWSEFDHRIEAATIAHNLWIDTQHWGTGLIVTATLDIRHQPESIYGVKDWCNETLKLADKLIRSLLPAIRDYTEAEWKVTSDYSGLGTRVTHGLLTGGGAIVIKTRDAVQEKDVLYICDMWAKRLKLKMKRGFPKY